MSQQRRRGPMGGRGMQPTEKAKDFKGSMKKLFGYMGRYKFRFILMFIFAVAGEQYGFIGCTLIVVLLFLITFECIRMSLRAKDLAGKIICCGVGSIVSIQSFINICVATGLAPNTGTPLPFVSYGLTSLISLFIGMGLVLNVGLQSSAYNKELQKKEQKKDAYFRKEEYL